MSKYGSVEKLDEIELLRLHGKILDAFEERQVCKTRNQPIAGYSRWLIKNKLGLQQVDNPNEKYDLYDGKVKYLVRSRQISKNKNIPFGVIRNIHESNFDNLITIVYDKDFNIIEAYMIPIDVLLNKVVYNGYQNGYILRRKHLDIIKDDIENIIDRLK